VKLVTVTIENFRSITKAYKIGFAQTTVLVGPNNEGKSNILRALVTAMHVLTREHAGPAPGGRYLRLPIGRIYDWHRDYPLDRQVDHPTGESVIVLEFQLSETELEHFREELGSKLSGTLPLKIKLGPGGDATVSFYKKGPGAKILSQKSRAIAEFVSKRLRFEHIPAVRTAQSAQQIVERLVAQELAKTEANPEYQEAVARVEALQQPALTHLAAGIQSTLSKFLPQVESVEISVSKDDRYRALRQACQIRVNDGMSTLLQYKGDGVQSLAALAIMRHAAQRTDTRVEYVIAIEEPESHLHPGAMHELRTVLAELAGQDQVVITTHNPLFVERTSIGSNIIVSGNRARPADTIEELREILGVRTPDNLRSALIVIVVEGDDDALALGALLCHVDSKLKSAFDNGLLAFDTLGGAGNLSYKLTTLRATMAQAYCFLDADAAAVRSLEEACKGGVLYPADYCQATVVGMKEAELEDLYEPSVYFDAVKDRFDVSLRGSRFRSARNKWTRRVEEVFKQQGKTLTDRMKAEVKFLVAQAVAAKPEIALKAANRGPFDTLARALAERLSRGEAPEVRRAVASRTVPRGSMKQSASRR